MDTIELIGYMAAFCTTIAYLPQALKTWRTKQARDISLPMFLLLNLGILLWLWYGLALGKWPIILANGVTVILSMSILFFKLKYR